MRLLLYIVTVVVVVALAFWSYGENYETREARADLRQLKRDIRTAGKRLDVLQSEWAYLNRPDRLQRLVDDHFIPLGLLPIDPVQFGGLDKIPLAATLENPAEPPATGEEQ